MGIYIEDFIYTCMEVILRPLAISASKMTVWYKVSVVEFIKPEYNAYLVICSRDFGRGIIPERSSNVMISPVEKLVPRLFRIYRDQAITLHLIILNLTNLTDYLNSSKTILPRFKNFDDSFSELDTW